MHGKKFEDVARQAFCQHYRTQVRPCGMFISRDTPFLAASPDGLVGMDEIIEIKCPYTGRNDQIRPCHLFPYLEETDSGYSLKKNHKYYFQIQGQLAISNKTNCYFVVYTFVDFFIQKIPCDNLFYTNYMLPKLKSFYIQQWRPFIASKVAKYEL